MFGVRVCVCVCVCVFCLFTPLLYVSFFFHSICCFLQEEPSAIAPKQQIYDYYKWIIFEKDIVESKFLVSVNYLFNALKIAAASTYQVM